MLWRYVLRALWPRALFMVVLGIMLFTLLDAMETARWLANGTWTQVLVLYACRTPAVAQQMLAPAVVLGMLATVGTFNRHAEMTSMAAAGLPLTRTILPAALALSGCAAGLHFGLGQWVIPATAQTGMELAINTFKMGDGRHAEFYVKHEWFRAGPIYARAQPGPDNRYHQVVGVMLDDQGRMVQRFAARSMEATQREGEFVLLDAVIHTFLPALAFETVARKTMHLPQAAAALSAPMGYPEVYALGPLLNVIARRDAGGRDTTPYRLALLRRLADPLMILLLGLLSIPLAARQRRDASVERLLFVGGVAVGLAQVLMMGTDMLAAKDVLPVWLAAACAPGLVALLGWAMWKGAEGAKAAR